MHVSAKPLGYLQHKCTKCRRKQQLLQRSAIRVAPDVAPPIVHEALRSSGQPLDRETRAFMEPRFGYDFSRTPVHPVNSIASNSMIKIGQAKDDYEKEADSTADRIMRMRDLGMPKEQKPRQYWDLSRIRVHTDAKAADSARSVNAQAFTSGQEILFGAGQFEPGTESGRKLIVHELVHVAQQNSGWHTEDSGFRIASQLIQRSTHTVCDENGCHEEPDEPDANAPDAGSAEEKTPDDASLPRGAPSTDQSDASHSTPSADQNTPHDAGDPDSGSAEEKTSDDASLPGGVPSTEQPDASQSTPSAEATTPSADQSAPSDETVPRPLSLSQTLDPITLSIEQLEVEINAIRRWLDVHPGCSERDQLEAAQSALENQLLSKQSESTDQPDQSTPSDETVPRPLSLSQTLDPATLSIEQLEVEIDLIRRWLEIYPGNGPEQEQLRKVQAEMENQLAIDKSVPEPRSLTQTLDLTTLSKEEMELEIQLIDRWLDVHPECGKREELQAAKEALENQLTILSGQNESNESVGPHDIQKNFLFGTDNPEYWFGPEHPWTKKMQEHPHMEQVREEIKLNLQRYCQIEAGISPYHNMKVKRSSNYSLNSLSTFANILLLIEDLKSYVSYGLIGQEPEFTFGSYRLEWEILSPSCSQGFVNASISFKASDIVRLGSGTRIPTTDIELLPDEPFGENAIFNSIRLNWSWIENLSFEVPKSLVLDQYQKNQIECVMEIVCPENREGGISTSTPEEIAEFNKKCKQYTGYDEEDLIPSEEDCYQYFNKLNSHK